MTRNNLTWQKAVRTRVGNRLTSEQRAAGWPNAFDLECVAELQYPDSGMENWRNLCAMLESLRAAVEAGTVPTVECTRTVDVMEEQVVPNYDAPSCTWNVTEWGAPDPNKRPHKRVTVKVGERIETFLAIERVAFRNWLAEGGEEPSEHIRAWLRPLESVQAHPEQSQHQKAKSETQGERVECCLSECERRACELGEPFDRWRMPGQKEQFLELLHRFDPSLRSIKTVESLDRYLSGRCRWPLEASVNPSAVGLYVCLFPSNSVGSPGAVQRQRKKA